MADESTEWRLLAIGISSQSMDNICPCVTVSHLRIIDAVHADMPWLHNSNVAAQRRHFLAMYVFGISRYELNVCGKGRNDRRFCNHPSSAIDYSLLSSIGEQFRSVRERSPARLLMR